MAHKKVTSWIAFGCTILMATLANAEIRLPALFTDHMVLQRGMENRVWGFANPSEEVTVAIAGQTQTAKADDKGRWEVKLSALDAGGPHEMVVEGSNRVVVSDILVGEVWLCSGQSNMQWPVDAARDADLEKMTAKFPQIRLITVPMIGTQVPQDDFAGSWQVCSPETVGDFSAVGFFFGRTLNRALDVPIGLIDNSWGGSAAEAWVNRELLANDPKYKTMMAKWAEIEANADNQKVGADFDAQVAAWHEAKKQALAQGTAAPQAPANSHHIMTGNARPGNLHNGVLNPVIGYGIRGAIWYQGETNAGRAYQYRHLFPLMIQSWRDEWKQGDFPFYWVQLADFMEETKEPQESAWAELREAQTMTLELPKSGQAVIIDIGEGSDIHPRNKQDVAQRLARLALAQDYGIQIQAQSPRFKSLEINGKKAVLTFENVGSGLRAVDFKEARGFAIAGEDKKFVWAQATVVDKDHIEVWNDAVAAPVAVRYAWGDNPVVNLQSAEGLPVTPFRTDDWAGVTATAE